MANIRLQTILRKVPSSRYFKLDNNGRLITTFSGNPGVSVNGVASDAFFDGVFIDGALVTLGKKTDARSTATDTTAVSAISLLKEISYMEQIPASRVVTDGGGSLTVDGSVSISGSVSNGLVQGITNTEIRATPLVVAGSITAIAAGDNNIGNVDIVTMPTVTVNPHNVVIASGSIMSGAVASGAIASGAIASGAVASGAFASGAISASAMADGAIVTVGAKTDARSTSTDATSTSMMAVLKEISYMEQNPASRAVTNAGTFVTQENGAALTSLQLLDNAVDGNYLNTNINVAGTDAAAGNGTTNAQTLRVTMASDSTGQVKLAAGTSKIGTATLDSGSSLAGRISSSQETSTVYNATTALTPKFFAISASMANSNTLVAGVAGKKIRVTGMAIMSASTVNVKFQSGAAGTDLTGYFPLVANTGFVLPDNPTGWFETTASALLNMFTSASVSLGGCGKYLEV